MLQSNGEQTRLLLVICDSVSCGKNDLPAAVVGYMPDVAKRYECKVSFQKVVLCLLVGMHALIIWSVFEKLEGLE